MSDFKLILSEVLKFINTDFSVFGYNLTISGVIIGCSVLSLVCYAIRKLYV